MNLNKAHRLIVHQVEIFFIFENLREEHYEMQAVVKESFNGVPIAQSDAKCDKYINKNQFYQSLGDSLNCRLMPESEK